MDVGEEVIITTFINCHLFWFIETRDLIIRNALHRTFKTIEHKKIQDLTELEEGEIILVYVENTWARAFVFTVSEEQIQLEKRKFVCWLVDHGVMREVDDVFGLPKGFQTCPHLAKQGSLHQVVNITKDITWDVADLAMVSSKTTEHVDAVRNGALDEIDRCKKVFFFPISEDQFNEYGDVILLNKNGEYESLTEKLIKKELLAKDEKLFSEIEPTRDVYFEKFFTIRLNWYKHVDNADTKNIEKKIFSTETNKTFSMEVFSRF